MKYKVTPVEDLDQARSALVRLWRDNLRFAFDPELKHGWYYVDNPQGQAAALSLGSADGEPGEPVGCLGLGVRRFSVRGQDCRAATYVDVAVDKQHRTLFPALMLLRAARRHTQQAFDFAYGEPNEYAVNVFAKLGFAQVGQMRRFARVLRHAPYVGRVVPVGPLARLGGETLDALDRLREQLRWPRLPRELRFCWLNAVDDRFDELWRRTRAQYTVVGYRGADYLRWRYHQAPLSRRCDIGALCNGRTGQVEAYAAVHDQRPAAALFDLFGPVDRLGVLVRALLPQLHARGFESVSIGLLGAPLLVAQLLELGFSERERGFTVIVDPQQHAAASSMLNASSWFLTDGDQDG